MKTVELVELDYSGYWTWKGNEDGYAMHSKCILAIYAGYSIGDPERWLMAHDLFKPEYATAIRKLDLGKGTLRHIAIIRRLARQLNVTVSTDSSEPKK